MKEKYHISGMTCSACSSHVEKSVNKLEDVEKASVNLLTETMEVTYDESRLSSDGIIAAVEKAGYGATLIAVGHSGQTVAACSGTECKVAGDGTALQPRDNGRLEPNSLQQKTAQEAKAMKWRLGISIAFLIPLMYIAMFHMYQDWFGLPIPKFVMNAFHGNENAMNFALTQFLLLLPILYVNKKFFAVGFKTLAHFSPNMDSLIALGASAATGYGIFAMYRIGYGLGHGDMALVEQYSHDLYFESAGMILTLITVGKFLESRSKGKTSDAITRLMDLSPKTAIVVGEDGTEKEIPTEMLRKGDVFLVKPGSLVPVDGTVLEGYSSVNEAAITGESVPVEKREGDRVISASMNKSGFLKCRADKVGEDTTLSQIIRLVEEASASKAPIAQIADKVAGIFVPVVIIIALLTLIGWLIAGADAEFAISTAIAVLVISCPCALGLATPVAIMVGTGVGAGHGILIKSGEALQQAKEIDTVVLDKTGTITTGQLSVAEINVNDMSLQTFLRIVAALEKKSEHPLAEAIAAHAAKQNLLLPEITEFQAVFGRGVEGVLAEDIPPSSLFAEADGPTSYATLSEKQEKNSAVAQQSGKNQVSDAAQKTDKIRKAPIYDNGAKAGTRYFVGNKAFLEEQGIRLESAVEEELNRMADEGKTPLLVAEEMHFLGMIGVEDTIRASSRQAVKAWHKMGVRVIMLTGDNKRTAESVRRKLQLEEVIAEVLPQEKERKVSELKKQGRKVAMIGDGINDSPALAAADVGIAIGAGTDVAMESADIILMKSDLRDAVTAMRLSRAVIRNIKENLFWAFFYNSIGIPLAAGLLYPAFELKLNPMFGAAAMSLSSIFVVGNALRLRNFKSGFKVQRQEAQVMEATEKQFQEREEKKMKKIITVEGMMCGHCTGRVQKALEAVDGVTEVVMSLEAKTATVTLEAEVADEKLQSVITEAGYEVTGVQRGE